MCDATGLLHFLTTIGEMGHGARAPSVPAVWEREILDARNPPRITCAHHEYEHQEVIDSEGPFATINQPKMVQQAFYFGARELRALRQHLPPHISDSCSTFELITACLWKCRTHALKMNPKQIVRLSCLVNARGKRQNVRIPFGYYGNAFAYPAAVSTAERICKEPFGYALELVMKAKKTMNDEYIRSVADLMVLRGRPKYSSAGNFIVSDTTRAGFSELNFGWGVPTFAGPAKALDLVSFYVQRKNKDENGVLVPICLPLSSMGIFQQEIEQMTSEHVENM